MSDFVYTVMLNDEWAGEFDSCKEAKFEGEMWLIEQSPREGGRSGAWFEVYKSDRNEPDWLWEKVYDSREEVVSE